MNERSVLGDGAFQQFVLQGQLGVLPQVGLDGPGPGTNDVEVPLLALEDVLLLVPRLSQQAASVVCHRIIYYISSCIHLSLEAKLPRE
jgi:hypothetical protein